MHLKSTKKLSFKAAKVTKSFTSGDLNSVMSILQCRIHSNMAYRHCKPWVTSFISVPLGTIYW